MSVNNSVNKIKNLIGIQKCLIIEGNVNDIYEHNGDYVNLDEKINYILASKGFDETFIWDRVDGVRGDLSNLLKVIDSASKKETTGSGYDFANDLVEQNSSEASQKFKTLAEFFCLISKTFQIAKNKKYCFIANLSDYIFGSEQTLSEEERNNLISISKALKEDTFSAQSILGFDSSIIFITNNLGKIPASFYLNNPEVVTITISKPNRNERSLFINTNKKLFNISDDLDDLKLADICDIMEGWTLKDAAKLIKYSNNIPNKLNFDSLLNSYQYGDTTSPWEELHYDKVMQIQSELQARVIGQDYAVDRVTKVVYKAFTGLSGVQYNAKRTKPKGTLFFVGPTGVGKTELAKALAKFLFGDEKNCIRFDMSEYSQEASDQKLIGAPPGYVGYEEGGQLTNAIKEKPFCVLLFDEIEKAHPKILDKFLQILEDGRLTDNKGQTVNFSDSLIIFTSNIGSADVDINQSDDMVKRYFIETVSNHFKYKLNRPELLGRIGNNIIPFNFIKDLNFKKELIRLKLKPIVNFVLEKYNIQLQFSQLELIIEQISRDSDAKQGGRDLLNSIEKNIVDPLSQFIFMNKYQLTPGKKIFITPTEQTIGFRITE